jgi:hypothetical protein
LVLLKRTKIGRYTPILTFRNCLLGLNSLVLPGMKF